MTKPPEDHSDIRRWIAAVVEEAPRASSPDIVERAPHAPDRSRKPALAAAVVIAILGLITVALVTRAGDRPDRYAVETGAEDPASWYVPVGLPDGWSLDHVDEKTIPRVACPCQYGLWASPDGRMSVELHRSASLEDKEPAGPTVPIGSGTDATLAVQGEQIILIWTVENQRSAMTTTGMDEQQAVAIAKALRAGPIGDQTRPGDLDLLSSLTTPGEKDEPMTVATVTMRTPRGTELSYRLTEPGALRSVVGPRVSERRPSGGSQPVIEVEAVDGSVVVHGLWDGADVTVPASGWIERGGLADAEQLITSLRPATREEWNRFKESATR